jgi:hypothetical protein
MAVYRLSGHKQLSDFVFYPHLYRASVFDTDDVLLSATEHSGVSNKAIAAAGSSSKKHTRTSSGPVSTPNALLTVFAAGTESSMALYNLGGVLFDSEKDRGGASMRESAVNLLSKSVMSLYNWYGGSSNSANSPTTGNTEAGANEKKSDLQKVQEATLTVVAKVSFLDPKRRVLKLSADPAGVYIAAADSLGRVTLFDTHVCAVVRIWKGLRHAELAWTSRKLAPNAAAGSTAQSANTSASSSAAALDTLVPSYATPHSPAGAEPPQSRPYAINLVIHAPLLGLVYIYAMPHGPCARIVPVGLNCHIFTMTAPTGGVHSGANSVSSSGREQYGSEEVTPRYCCVSADLHSSFVHWLFSTLTVSLHVLW